MCLSKEQKNAISDLLINAVRDKLKKYEPETSYMPFHYRLLGKDRYAMFSFIQSINTTFGMSIWEQVAVALAQGVGYQAERQFKLLGEINGEAEKIINKLHYDLRKSTADANKDKETKQIKDVITAGQKKIDPDSTVDLFVKIDSEENYFDITSVKPNMKEFVSLKLKLLRWSALRLSRNVKANIFTRLAIPYNPYHPNPYERWTLKGLYDLDAGEILVGEEFWNFIGGGNIYDNLLDVFQEVGDKLRKEIDIKFSQLRK